jgi:hypothetical protein
LTERFFGRAQNLGVGKEAGVFFCRNLSCEMRTGPPLSTAGRHLIDATPWSGVT